MPVIDLPLKRVNELLGKQLSLEELEEYCLQLGADIDDKREDGVKVEYNPNRPDFSSVAGFVRALKGIMNLETGLPNYPLKKGSIKVKVEKSVEPLRPFIQCAVVRNVHLTKESIAELMNTQETIHWVVGRDRKKVSIGIHDMRDITPPFRYYGEKADSHAFIPLGEESRKMTPKEICEEHPKGVKYAHLVNKDGSVPFLVDSKGGVLSFPPIINGILTLVTEKSKDLFIDVTGTDEQAVKNALEILTSSFAEEGYQVEQVTVEYPDKKTLITPTFQPSTWYLRPKYLKEVLGLDLTQEELFKNLERSRFGVIKKESTTKRVAVSIPSYRVDILHEVDIVEDVAISYGYHNIEALLDNIHTIGEEHPVIKRQNQCRDIMVGLGFIEVVTYTLVSKEWQYTKMRTKGTPVELLNPVSKEYNIVRDSLLPSLINALKQNKPYPLPQQIFDIGDVVRINDAYETKASREVFLSGATIHSKADFVEVKAIVEAIFRGLGISDYTLESASHPSFFEGRCARILVDKEPVGIFGEIHPEVLNNFELENPVAAFEIELEKLFPKL
ncbi:MAG: phenylalanine--tRNA ligase subunit beta [Candidatus Heimdallarchaeota archaeon]|nr:phenylalanine--tRNA ligase subunit beta [Candidatus Heimdallarchaeota archaeon]